MSNKKEIATHQALVAILYVAKEQGTDIGKLCETVKSGLFDSGNLYRYTSADSPLCGTVYSKVKWQAGHNAFCNK